MAFFVRNRTFSAIIQKTFGNSALPRCNRLNSAIQLAAIRVCSSFPHPKYMPTDEVDLNAQPNVEITKNAAEWKYVERILPPVTIPEPKPKASYPSGWTPQKPEALNHPYFIQRNANYMLPVYLQIDKLGTFRRTRILNIRGDIWKFHNELMEYIEYYMAKRTRSKVNEFARTINIWGDYVNLVKDFLIKKGF